MVVNQNARVGVNRPDNDTVTWNALGTAGPWTVVFLSASPFSAGTFVVPAGGTVSSGTANGSANLGKYRYQVQNSSGTVTDDPDIIIES
jgi:hypothetical protein